MKTSAMGTPCWHFPINLLPSFGKSSRVFPGAAPFLTLCACGLLELLLPPGLDVSMLPHQGLWDFISGVLWEHHARRYFLFHWGKSGKISAARDYKEGRACLSVKPTLRRVELTYQELMNLMSLWIEWSLHKVGPFDFLDPWGNISLKKKKSLYFI